MADSDRNTDGDDGCDSSADDNGPEFAQCVCGKRDCPGQEHQPWCPLWSGRVQLNQTRAYRAAQSERDAISKHWLRKARRYPDLVESLSRDSDLDDG